MEKPVRAMQQTDIDSVYAIELQAHRAPWSRQILSDCVTVGYDCRVFEVDTEVVAYVICRYNESICHILNLCVAPALQGKGYGQCLLQEVIDSPKAPTDKIRLEVRPSNAVALHLYQKMGFQHVSTKRGYYRDLDVAKIEDALVLEKIR